jgi:MoaA/NifB/PqqE/SkfB family radical SAM enzyme
MKSTLLPWSSLPLNYTLGLTYNCNSRCKTCRIYDRPKVEEMTYKEWEEIFKKLGKAPYWVTFTGGEPFLYSDLVEVFGALCTICQPKRVNIPTNGLLPERVVEWTREICKLDQRVKVTVNVSIDDIGAYNDDIRGVPGAYTKALATLQGLSNLHSPNLQVGVHTVLSKFNTSRFSIIYPILSHLVKPSMYITEIAENRVELGTTSLDIQPSSQDYHTASTFLSTSHLFTIKGLIRKAYYNSNITKAWPKCYAGHASCQITPDGEVWFCCIKAKSIGNLKQKNYDFKSLWEGPEARQLREEVSNCSCSLANAYYTNILRSPWKMVLR